MLESFLIKFNKLDYRTPPVAAYGSIPQAISVMNSCIPSDEKNFIQNLKSDSHLPKKFVLFASLKTL